MQIIKETATTITVKGEHRILKFWKHGAGLIPLHRNPKIEEDIYFQISDKRILEKMTTPDEIIFENRKYIKEIQPVLDNHLKSGKTRCATIISELIVLAEQRIENALNQLKSL